MNFKEFNKIWKAVTENGELTVIPTSYGTNKKWILGLIKALLVDENTRKIIRIGNREICYTFKNVIMWDSTTITNIPFSYNG